MLCRGRDNSDDVPAATYRFDWLYRACFGDGDAGGGAWTAVLFRSPFHKSRDSERKHT
jgi:hypothetical protein